MFLILITGILLQILAWLMSGVRLARGLSSDDFSVKKPSFMNKILSKDKIFSKSRVFSILRHAFMDKNLKIRRTLLLIGLFLITIYSVYMSDMMLLFGQFLLGPILWYRIGLDSTKAI